MEQGRPSARGRSGEDQGSFAEQAGLQAELAATRRYIDERRERPERHTAVLSRSGTWSQQAITRPDEHWDPLRLDLLETTAQRVRNLVELARTPGLRDEELSLIAGPWDSLTDGLLEVTVRIGREVESLATTVADLIGARETMVPGHVSHTVRPTYSGISMSPNNDYSVYATRHAERGSSYCRLNSAVLDWRINVWSWKKWSGE